MRTFSNPVRVAIVGASGYSGEELVRLLLHHPRVQLVAVTSRQNAGQTLASVFPRFASHPVSRTLRLSEPDAAALDESGERARSHGVPPALLRAQAALTPAP